VTDLDTGNVRDGVPPSRGAEVEGYAEIAGAGLCRERRASEHENKGRSQGSNHEGLLRAASLVQP
jgi:hypothetical protein